MHFHTICQFESNKKQENDSNSLLLRMNHIEYVKKKRLFIYVSTMSGSKVVKFLFVFESSDFYFINLPNLSPCHDEKRLRTLNVSNFPFFYQILL